METKKPRGGSGGVDQISRENGNLGVAASARKQGGGGKGDETNLFVGDNSSAKT